MKKFPQNALPQESVLLGANPRVSAQLRQEPLSSSRAPRWRQCAPLVRPPCGAPFPCECHSTSQPFLRQQLAALEVVAAWDRHWEAWVGAAFPFPFPFPCLQGALVGQVVHLWREWPEPCSSASLEVVDGDRIKPFLWMTLEEAVLAVMRCLYPVLRFAVARVEAGRVLTWPVP